jgi:stage IV sporulation protein FB
MADKVLLVFGAVILHEAAHVFVAVTLGYRVKEVELLPFGAVARIERLNEAGSLNEIMIAAAGPLTSFGLAVISYMLAQELALFKNTLLFFYQVNLMLAFFNMLPALPLDGGRILRAVLTLRKGSDYCLATRQVVFLSYVVSAALFGWAVVQYLIESSINITVLFAAIFLCATAKGELNIAGFRAMRHLSGKKALLAAKNIMLTSHFTAFHLASLGEVIRLFRSEEYNMVLVVDEDFKWQKTLTETQIFEAMTEKGINTKIGDI